MTTTLSTLLCYCILSILLLQSIHSLNETSENENTNDDESDMNIIDESVQNMDQINNETINNNMNDNEEDVMEENQEIEQLYTLLHRMYSAITHGDSRYFNMVMKDLKNDTFTEYLENQDILEAIETNFVHILNTMHLVSEIAIKIHATPMYVNLYHLYYE